MPYPRLPFLAKKHPKGYKIEHLWYIYPQTGIKYEHSTFREGKAKVGTPDAA